MLAFWGLFAAFSLLFLGSLWKLKTLGAGHDAAKRKWTIARAVGGIAGIAFLLLAVNETFSSAIISRLDNIHNTVSTSESALTSNDIRGILDEARVKDGQLLEDKLGPIKESINANNRISDHLTDIKQAVSKHDGVLWALYNAAKGQQQLTGSITSLDTRLSEVETLMKEIRDALASGSAADTTQALSQISALIKNLSQTQAGSHMTSQETKQLAGLIITGLKEISRQIKGIDSKLNKEQELQKTIKELQEKIKFFTTDPFDCSGDDC